MRITAELRAESVAESHWLAAMPEQLALLSGEVLGWLLPVLLRLSKLTSKNLVLAIDPSGSTRQAWPGSPAIAQSGERCIARSITR